MLAFLAKYYYNIIIYSGQKGCIDMCNCENEEKGADLGKGKAGLCISEWKKDAY